MDENNAFSKFSSIDKLSRELSSSISLAMRPLVVSGPDDATVLAKANELVKKTNGKLLSLSKLHDVPLRKRILGELGFNQSIVYAPSYYGIYVADTQDILGIKYQGIFSEQEKVIEHDDSNYSLRIIEIGRAAYEASAGFTRVFDHVNSPQISVPDAAAFAAFKNVVNAQISKEVADFYRHAAILALGHDPVLRDSKRIPNEIKIINGTFYEYRRAVEPLLRCIHVLDTGTFEVDISKIDDKYELLESHYLLKAGLDSHGDDDIPSDEVASFNDTLDYLISKANLLFRDSKLRQKTTAEDISKLQDFLIDLRLKRL